MIRWIAFVSAVVASSTTYSQSVVRDFIPPLPTIVRDFVPPVVVKQPVTPPAVVKKVEPVPASPPIKKSVQHWSFPGHISTHLKLDHGQNVTGLSIEEQLNLHDSLHQRATQSNCPNGMCPTSQQNYVPFSVFRRY